MKNKVIKTISLCISFIMIFLSLSISILADDDVKFNDVNKHSYRIVEKAMTYKDAELYCEDLGGHLAAINDKDEEIFIEKILELSKSDRYLIGAYKQENDVNWQWVTGENLYFNNFNLQEGDKPEKEFAYINKANLKWGKEYEIDTRYPFICEWEKDYNTMLDRIEISSNEINLSIGKSKNISLLGIQKNGYQIDLTKKIVLNSTNKKAATAANGLIKAIGAGETNLIGSFDGITINIHVVVKTTYPIRKINIYSIPKSIVAPRYQYTYKMMEKDIYALKKYFKDNLEIQIIGKSLLKRNIYCIKIGTGSNKVIYTGATHAREYIGSILLMEYTEMLLRKSQTSNDHMISSYYARNILSNSTVFIVPMVNPDGVEMVFNGVDKRSPFYNTVLRMNKGNKDFTSWRANARGVDINRNFNYRFKLNSESGKKPESEPEAYAISKLIRNVNPKVLLNFHSIGNLIFSIGKNSYPEIYKYGTKLSKLSGYKFEYPSIDWGGCTDYAISYSKGKIKAYTIEVGSSKSPVPMSQYNSIWNRCYSILTFTSSRE